MINVYYGALSLIYILLHLPPSTLHAELSERAGWTDLAAGKLVPTEPRPDCEPPRPLALIAVLAPFWQWRVKMPATDAFIGYTRAGDGFWPVLQRD